MTARACRGAWCIRNCPSGSKADHAPQCQRLAGGSVARRIKSLELKRPSQSSHGARRCATIRVRHGSDLVFVSIHHAPGVAGGLHPHRMPRKPVNLHERPKPFERFIRVCPEPADRASRQSTRNRQVRIEPTEDGTQLGTGRRRQVLVVLDALARPKQADLPDAGEFHDEAQETVSGGRNGWIALLPVRRNNVTSRFKERQLGPPRGTPSNWTLEVSHRGRHPRRLTDQH